MKTFLKVMILTMVLSSFVFANTKHINYIMSSNTNLKKEQAENLYKKFKKYSDMYKIDVELALAIANVESKFRETAESGAGAYGIMQIMPITSEHYNKNRKNLDENIEIGFLHLNDSIKAFGKTDNAIASYNAGIGRIKSTSYKNIPETRFYVAKVKQELEKLKYNIKVDKERELEVIKQVVEKKIKGKIKFEFGEEQEKEVQEVAKSNEENENEEVGLEESTEELAQNKVEEQKEEIKRLGFKLGGLGMLPNND